MFPVFAVADARRWFPDAAPSHKFKKLFFRVSFLKGNPSSLFRVPSLGILASAQCFFSPLPPPPLVQGQRWQKKKGRVQRYFSPLSLFCGKLRRRHFFLFRAPPRQSQVCKKKRDNLLALFCRHVKAISLLTRQDKNPPKDFLKCTPCLFLRICSLLKNIFEGKDRVSWKINPRPPFLPRPGGSDANPPPQCSKSVTPWKKNLFLRTHPDFPSSTSSP